MYEGAHCAPLIFYGIKPCKFVYFKIALDKDSIACYNFGNKNITYYEGVLYDENEKNVCLYAGTLFTCFCRSLYTGVDGNALCA